MQAAMLGFLLLVGGDPGLDAGVAEFPMVPGVMRGNIDSCPQQAILSPPAFRRRGWSYPPPLSDYIYRRFDYCYQYDYPWHSHVRVAWPCCPGVLPDGTSAD